MKNETIKLAHGSGGKEMGELISLIRNYIPYKGAWECTDEDSAVLKYTTNQRVIPIGGTKSSCLEKDGDGDLFPLLSEEVCPPYWRGGRGRCEKLVFTTDAFVVTPIFFNGGNIGDLAFNGTLNDLLMQGATPLGLSLALVIEEGFPLEELEKILKTIGKLSKETKIPIATGDTKVVGKGALDKIMITTAGVGITNTILSDSGLKPGDKIIASGTLGDHGATLLAHRFNYKTKLKSDTKPLDKEIQTIRKYLTSVKDPTRGGAAAVLNEMAKKSKVKILLNEKDIPISKEAASIAKLLGIKELSLASEGRFIAGVPKKNVEKILKILKKFNKNACAIGEVKKGEGVFIKNSMGEKKLSLPSGILIPRIC